MRLFFRSILLAIILLTASSVLPGCSGQDQSHVWPDKLVVGTVYGPTTFFIMRGDTLGYEYDRMCDLAEDKGVELEFVVAPNLNTLVTMLSKGEIDIIAAQVPTTSDYKRQVISCGAKNETRPVLVQSANGTAIKDVAQLSGKDVYVETGSRYESVITNLNSQLGGAIIVHTFPQDSVSTDDLLDMVSNGKIQYTVIDSDFAEFNANNYDGIDVSLTMGGTQLSSWAVSFNNKWLADSIDAWSNSTNARTYSKTALERYVKKMRKDETGDLSDEIPHIGSRPSQASWSPHYGGNVGNGPSRPLQPSSFDQLFTRYGGASGWDARLLSSIARVESNYNPRAQSWAGARGLMQIMPGTARGYGVSVEQLYDPETNIRLGAKCISSANKTFSKRIPDRNERLKFILAAYNAGAGHVLDAMALAQKYGRDPQRWDGNVEEAMLWKSNPQYYNDPVCRFGYCRGREPVGYVKKVLSHYR